MKFTIQQMLQNVSAAKDKEALAAILAYVADSLSTVALNSAGLVIKAGGSALVKTGGSDFYALVRGTLVKIASATDMAALSGTVTNAKFNVFCYFVDASGTKTTVMGTEGSTLGALKFPDFPLDKCLIGFTIINPTGTGNFVGGTTAIDDVTVVPNAVHVSPIGGVDPTVLYS